MRRQLGAGVALCAVLSGCSVGSVGPYYQTAAVVFDSTLLGTWTDSVSHTRAVFMRDGNRYDIAYTSMDGKSARFVGRLFRLGDATALDILPGQLPDSIKASMADAYWSSFVSLHSLWWLDWRGDRLASTTFVEDSLRAFVVANPDVVQHLGNEQTLILTAPAADLQTFVLEYRRRPNVFVDSTVWKRSK